MSLPSTITLTQPADASPATASDQRTDHTAIQGAVNGLIGYLGSLPGIASYRKVTAEAVNTTTSATDLLNGEVTIGAGVLGTTSMLRLTAFGDWKNASGSGAAPPRLQLILGSTTLVDTGVTGTITTNAARYRWGVAATVMNLGATNAQWTDFQFGSHITAASVAVQNVFTTGEGVYFGAGAYPNLDARGGNSSGVDTTVAQALILNVINGSANAAYETKLVGAVVEII